MCPPLVSRLSAVPSSELSSVLASMQTSELTAYVLTLTLLSSERRRHSRSRSRRGHRRPPLLLRGGGREGTLVLSLASLPSLTESHGWRAVLSGRGVAKVPL